MKKTNEKKVKEVKNRFNHLFEDDQQLEKYLDFCENKLPCVPTNPLTVKLN